MIYLPQIQPESRAIRAQVLICLGEGLDSGTVCSAQDRRVEFNFQIIDLMK